MLLHFTAKSGYSTIKWTDYAKLRDNVQHHIEGTLPSGAFEMLHRIEEAVDSGGTTLEAYRLHHELIKAWYGLAKRAPQEMAIGNRTLAIVLGLFARTVGRHTLPVTEVGLQLPNNEAGYLCNCFRDTFRMLFALTATAQPGDVITVTRVGYTKPNDKDQAAA